MRVGIVAEGKGDVAVLRNILKGKLGLEKDETVPIRPELSEDRTDQSSKKAFAQPTANEFSNWLHVLDECRDRMRIEEFLQNQIDEERFVVVHIDTAEAHAKGYDVARPDRKEDGYVTSVRALVVAKLEALLGTELSASVRFAIAVEETDAWLLTIHDEEERRDTGVVGNPKKRMRYLLKARFSDGPHELSRDFRRRTSLEACCQRNASLRLFVESLSPTDEGLNPPA